MSKQWSTRGNDLTLELSPEQKAAVFHDIVPMCITACAGSGKTRTAVHRLAELRSRMDKQRQRGSVALLSFSNVAVDTFRGDYRSQHQRPRNLQGVDIDTMDGFLTKYVLKPHAYLSMQSQRSAFLIQGFEPFAMNYTVYDGKRPHKTSDLRISHDGNAFQFEVGRQNNPMSIAAHIAKSALEKLGKTGAYSHEAGRYWALRTLHEHPFVLRALARRFPYIIVDEAQDVGQVHEQVLQLLGKAGVQITLIGDSNQGIYEFAGANGSFLNEYDSSDKTYSMHLTRNFRSVPSILTVANNISGRKDTPDRPEPSQLSGAYFTVFKENDQQALLSSFRNMLGNAEISAIDAVVVCRGNATVEKWTNRSGTPGQGIVNKFVRAAISRDVLGSHKEAFQLTLQGVISLLDKKHEKLSYELLQSSMYPEHRSLRQVVWSFAKSKGNGLPACNLVADSEWHPLLKERLKKLLNRLGTEFNLTAADNIGNKLKKTRMPNSPLYDTANLINENKDPIRTCTVHQVKGESIGAVLYIAKKKQVEALISGTTSEEGRIGYVAVTRAKNLFVLASSENCISKHQQALIDQGFQRI